MAKRSHTRIKTKKSSTRPRKSTIGYYFQIFVLSAFVGLAVYIGGRYFFTPQLCANSLTCESDLSVKIEKNASGIFQGHKVTAPNIDLAYETPGPAVLGANVPNGEKHIYIDLAEQILYAYQGNTKVMQAYTATGRWGRTPVGNFHVWEKLISTLMAGGSGADAYYLPNVPYVMYFYRDFGIHGAYWHDNFGHTMSHGCVNMRQIDAKALYTWADGPGNGHLGTPVSTCDHFIEPGTCIQNNPIN